jgi:hypothetical protein
MRTGFRTALGLAVVLAAGVRPAPAGLTRPWDDLAAVPNANWIDPCSVNMYAANTSDPYPVSFNTVNTKGAASGMNSLRFVDTTDAHHVSSALAGRVAVLATGGVPFSGVLVLVAIDAASLPANFALTMNGYTCDPQADFVFYDGTAHAAGRPSGYYPAATNPAYEPIAYDFNTAMVTVLAFTGLTLDSAHSVALDYSFENLPGRAVFSVYGWPDGGTEIYHTNRGLAENGIAGTVSTFEVLPLPGDADGDGAVGAADYVILKQHMGTSADAGASEGDFDNDGKVDFGDLCILTGNFGAAGGAPAAIPEPASLALLACGATALRRKTGKRRQPASSLSC